MTSKKQVAFLIKLIHDDIEKGANRKLKENDLTLAQVRILMYLERNKEKETYQKDIENFFGVSHPTVVGLLQRLEKKGYIRFVSNNSDKRLKMIKLTHKDDTFYEGVIQHTKNVERKLLKDLTDEEQSQLTYLLSKVYNNIKESTP